MQIELPPEFDPNYYINARTYLPLNEEILRHDFETYGKNEGAPGSFFCYRENVLKVFAAIKGPVLEIGPGHGPDFVGDNVKYLDLAYKEELEKLYPDLPDKNGGTPFIHYLIGDLANNKIREKFDLVYSAHNIEHQANLVLHLNSIANILNPGGYFLAMVPNKNYSFDYYRELSTLIDILAAPMTQTMHTPRTAMNLTNQTHNRAMLHWLGDHGQTKQTDNAIIDAWLKFDKKTFKSYHVNTFVPESFKAIFGILCRKQIIKLDLLRVYNTPFGRNEFVAIFQKPQ